MIINNKNKETKKNIFHETKYIRYLHNFKNLEIIFRVLKNYFKYDIMFKEK